MPLETRPRLTRSHFRQGTAPVENYWCSGRNMIRHSCSDDKNVGFLSSNIKQVMLVSVSFSSRTKIGPKSKFHVFYLLFRCSIFLPSTPQTSSISPVLLSGFPILSCPTSGSQPRHLSLAVCRSRPNAERGRCGLVSAWQLCGQQTRHLYGQMAREQQAMYYFLFTSSEVCVHCLFVC